MKNIPRNLLTLVLLFACTMTLQACAPTDLVIKPAYQTTGDSKGPGGTMLLASSLDGTKGVDRIQYIYGEVKDGDGKVKGHVTGQIAPAAMVRDALQQEMLKAGYAVKLVTELPKGVDMAVMLSKAEISTDEVTSVVKSEAECKVNIILEVWKKGDMIRRLTYGKTVLDYAMKDRDKLHQQLLQKALGAVMKDASADVVNYLK